MKELNNNKMYQSKLPIAIIGGGPIGLAAAAHLTKNKLPFVLFESGESVGQNILSWSHVQLFSPWKYNIDQAAKELLQQGNWKAPNDTILPSGGELVAQYLFPLADLPEIKPHIKLNSQVRAIGRKGLDKMKTLDREKRPFSIKVEEKNAIKYYEASAVIDATGTWNQPNPIDSGCVFAAGEEQLNEHIYYGIPNVKNEHLNRFKNKKIAVVGSGHSAINTLLDLAEIQTDFPKTNLNWILRKENLNTVYGGKKDDTLAARGALGSKIEQLVNSRKINVFAPFHILDLSEREGSIQTKGSANHKLLIINDIDEIISTTGARPNLEMLWEVRLGLDPSLESVNDLAALIDPNVHSCGTVRPHGEKELRHPEEGFYILGAKSYGRAPTFLMTTGYEQVRSVVAYLAGDLEAASRQELNLPATGVCSGNLETKNDFAETCCKTSSDELINSCC